MSANVLIDQERWEKILALDLKKGGHDPDSTFCVMEAAAFVAGETWSDHPECVDPVFSDLLIAVNDSRPSDAERNRLLRPLIPRIVGTRDGDELSTRRAWMVIDWSLRSVVPLIFRSLKMDTEADKWAAQEEFTESFARALDRARALDLGLDLDLDLGLARDRARDLARALTRALARALDLARVLTEQEIADFQAKWEISFLSLIDRMLGAPGLAKSQEPKANG
jgi:hypothetical protein